MLKKTAKRFEKRVERETDANKRTRLEKKAKRAKRNEKRVKSN